MRFTIAKYLKTYKFIRIVWSQPNSIFYNSQNCPELLHSKQQIHCNRWGLHFQACTWTNYQTCFEVRRPKSSSIGCGRRPLQNAILKSTGHTTFKVISAAFKTHSQYAEHLLSGMISLLTDFGFLRNYKRADKYGCSGMSQLLVE